MMIPRIVLILRLIMLKKKLDYQMMIVIIIVMNQISVFLNKSNTRNHNLILRFKSLGKRKVEKWVPRGCIIYIFIFILNWEIIVALKHVKFIVHI